MQRMTGNQPALRTRSHRSHRSHRLHRSCLSPLIMTEALLAESCRDFDDMWAYRIVTLGSECLSICCTSYNVRPPFTKNNAYWCRKSCRRRWGNPALARNRCHTLVTVVYGFSASLSAPGSGWAWGFPGWNCTREVRYNTYISLYASQVPLLARCRVVI